jgi:uncharacterized protein YjhX (UPF0386 family)
MPTIDIHATTGMFADTRNLAMDAATVGKTVVRTPDIAMFRKNTTAVVHELPAGALADIENDANYVRVQVLTNAGALHRDKQMAVVRQLTELVATAAGDPDRAELAWPKG